MENLKRLAQIRVALGDNVPCHADPIYFHPAEKPENVARHFIAALAGVPMLSMDPADLTAKQTESIRFWLGFYREHLETFKSGHWEVHYFMDTVSYITTTKHSEAIAILTRPELISHLVQQFAGKDLYLLNLSGETLTYPSANTCDCCGNPVPGNPAPLGGLLHIRTV